MQNLAIMWVSEHFHDADVEETNPTTQTTYALREIRIDYYLQQQKKHR